MALGLWNSRCCPAGIQDPPTEEAEGTIVDCRLGIRAEKTRMGKFMTGDTSRLGNTKCGKGIRKALIS